MTACKRYWVLSWVEDNTLLRSAWGTSWIFAAVSKMGRQYHNQHWQRTCKEMHLQTSQQTERTCTELTNWLPVDWTSRLGPESRYLAGSPHWTGSRPLGRGEMLLVVETVTGLGQSLKFASVYVLLLSCTSAWANYHDIPHTSNKAIKIICGMKNVISAGLIRPKLK